MVMIFGIITPLAETANVHELPLAGRATKIPAFS